MMIRIGCVQWTSGACQTQSGRHCCWGKSSSSSLSPVEGGAEDVVRLVATDNNKCVNFNVVTNASEINLWENFEKR